MRDHDLFDRDRLVLRRRAVASRTRMKNRLEAMRQREALAELDNLPWQLTTEEN